MVAPANPITGRVNSMWVNLVLVTTWSTIELGFWSQLCLQRSRNTRFNLMCGIISACCSLFYFHNPHTCVQSVLCARNCPNHWGREWTKLTKICVFLKCIVYLCIPTHTIPTESSDQLDFTITPIMSRPHLFLEGFPVAATTLISWWVMTCTWRGNDTYFNLGGKY